MFDFYKNKNFPFFSIFLRLFKHFKVNNKPFTKELRKSLKEEFVDDPDQTYVYYEGKYSERMKPIRSKYSDLG